MKRPRSVVSSTWRLAAGFCVSAVVFASPVQAQDATTKDATTKDAKNSNSSTKDSPDEERHANGGDHEGWLMNGVFAVGTGLQGGDPGTGSVAWARARTRLMAGVDLRSDEARSDGIGFYGFAEIERRASFGAEVRYERWWTSTIAFHAAILGTIVPESMVGGGVGARFGFPIANKLTLFLEPGFAVFPFGSDLPANSIILWGTLIGGVGVAL